MRLLAYLSITASLLSGQQSESVQRGKPNGKAMLNTKNNEAKPDHSAAQRSRVQLRGEHDCAADTAINSSREFEFFPSRRHMQPDTRHKRFLDCRNESRERRPVSG